MSNRIAIFTAADARFFDYLRGAVQSIRDKPEGRDVILVVLDLGLSSEHLQWLARRVDAVRKPDWHIDFPGRAGSPVFLRGLYARPFLREYYAADCYLWIDADAWVQDWSAVGHFVGGAFRRGLAIVPEVDRGNRMEYGLMPGWWSKMRHWYDASFGPAAHDLCSYPGLNAGVFALSASAPHWDVWRQCLVAALQRNCDIMTDQIALNYAIYRCGLFDRTEFLPAWCNWTCHFGLPCWDQRRLQFVEPNLPHTPIGIVHLTGLKFDRTIISSTDGTKLESDLRYAGSMPSVVGNEAPLLKSFVPASEVDYVSPGLEIIVPDIGFPNMVRGDPAHCQWPHLPHGIPHSWYVDRRMPNIGFPTRDEAAILYNTAKLMRGQRALEIGCWMGWSTCHLALGGVVLDVIDPNLENAEIRDSVFHSLRINRASNTVTLFAAQASEAFRELAIRNSGWSLFFIDGDHAVVKREAAFCARYATEDAIILIHDLASPDVAAGLDFLQKQGWHVLVYQTMHMMGVAWRGRVVPIMHTADPAVVWEVPEHLRNFPISETPPLLQSTS
jgi:predicted O-methyltransferase YrrM